LAGLEKLAEELYLGPNLGRTPSQTQEWKKRRAAEFVVIAVSKTYSKAFGPGPLSATAHAIRKVTWTPSGDRGARQKKQNCLQDLHA
jgi:hypothetical protein